MADAQAQNVLPAVYAGVEVLHDVQTGLKYTGTETTSLVVAALVVPEASSQEGFQTLLEDV